jgi:hypothetical protein
MEKHLGTAISAVNVADRTVVSITPRWIVCGTGARHQVLEFGAAYAEQQGAIILDQGRFTLMTPDQLRQSASLNPAD